MDFISERGAITKLAEMIVKAGASLFNATKFIYSIADEDFYNVNIKDALKIVLNNISDPDSLQLLGLRMSGERCREMSSDAYGRALSLAVYSFAVRIPVLKKYKVGEQVMSDEQLLAVYDAVIERGGANIDGIISDGYVSVKQLVKKGKSVPPYSADWYKTYIYTHVPELSAISNKNMFLLGFADVLFTMFYSCLEEELKNIIEAEAVRK